MEGLAAPCFGRMIAPGVHSLAARCMILKYVHPAGASFFETLNISVT